MKRILLLVAAAAVLVVPASSIAGATQPTVKLRKTSKGKILVNGKGFTLYMFSRDKRNKDTCMKIAGCPAAWPPLTVKGAPTAGPGVRKSLLGTIKLSGGKKQVTYAGHPLYRYAFDVGPGNTSYIGVNLNGGFWYALSASGKAVK